MRFKKGSKVEVLNKREVPSGSWWCAEIISGNGHTYHVKYDRYLTEMGSASERVSRKAIRPRPPVVEGLRFWVPGDIVEVFDNHSWKLAEVSRVLGRSHFFVRLLGSSMEFRAHTSCIRMRQYWQDNKWVAIRKDSGKCLNGAIDKLPKEGKIIRRKTKPRVEENNCAGSGHLTVKDYNVFPQFLSKGTKRRLLFCSSPVETNDITGEKLRTIYKERSDDRLAVANSSTLHEKVDAVATQKILCEKYMHASLNNKITGFSETQRGDGINDSDDTCYFRLNLIPSDTESVSSSVGSCSANNSPCRSLNCSVDSEDLCSCSSDAQTSFLGIDSSVPTEQASKEDIHQLELHAYKTTLMALFASGPMSWDQETLMSNLRCMLHISNDEHLIEVKNLVSAEKEISYR